MFSPQEYLDKKTGPYGIGRFSYLQSLVTEFQDTDDDEAKEQVLANLANFAYDPINYEYLRVLNVLDLFLDCLSEPNERLVEYATGGICNLALEKENKAYLLKNEGIQLTIKCLSSSCEETVISAITTLMYLMAAESRAEITSIPVVDAMLRFSQSSNPRIRNLATVFLEDYVSVKQLAIAQGAQSQLQIKESECEQQLLPPNS